MPLNKRIGFEFIRQLVELQRIDTGQETTGLGSDNKRG